MGGGVGAVGTGAAVGSCETVGRSDGVSDGDSVGEIGGNVLMGSGTNPLLEVATAKPQAKDAATEIRSQCPKYIAILKCEKVADDEECKKEISTAITPNQSC